MLIGLIRPIETHTITLKGEELAELEALVPEGWRLLSVRTV